jgi:hypothetical protein
MRCCRAHTAGRCPNPQQHQTYLHHTPGKGLPTERYRKASQRLDLAGRQSGCKEVGQTYQRNGLHMLHQGLAETSPHSTNTDLINLYFLLGPGMGAPLQTVALVARSLSMLYNKPLIGVNHCVGRR